ncbi:MAG: hypothetical protein ACTSQE_04170 [Candidatus Heimdallarchaeaceae archaeon]
MTGERSSYDGDLARLMSEARDLFRSANYTQAANKYLQAAKVQHESRGIEQAKDLYTEAIKNFIRASEEYKEKKQYRTSAQNLYQIAEIYKILNAKDDWVAVMRAVVEDLINAAQDYLQLWNDYERAITLVSASCFLLFSIEDFATAEQYYNQYIAKIQGDPGFTSAQQVLYAAGYAIKAVKDLDAKALLNAQQLVGSHLKPHLSQMVGDFFLNAIDNAIDNVVRVFRSKIKLPKIVPELVFSRDLVLNEPSDLTIHLENEGEGDAFNISFQLNIPDEIEILDGKREFVIEELPAGKTSDYKLVFRCMSAIGEVTHEISGKITFYDQLQTKQTMMIGPYDLIFREVSLAKELGARLAELESTSLKYRSLLLETGILPESLSEQVVSLINAIIKESEEKISEEEFETVKANISTIKKLFSLFEQITSEEYVKKIKEMREQEIKARLDEAVEDAKATLLTEFEEEKRKIQEAHEVELQNLETRLRAEFEAEKEKIIAETTERFKEQHEKELEELMQELNNRHAKELEEAREEAERIKEQALEEQRNRLEEEKRKALEEQESLLQEEFQKRLSSLQNARNNE